MPTLTLRGGGWVIVAMAGVALLFLGWALSGIFFGTRPIGGGADPAAYKFQLEPMKADRAFLVGSGNPRDFLQTLDQPGVMQGADMVRYNEQLRSKYVVTGDRVAGVVVNGQARAYPLAVLNAHEVCNDTLGGVPIAVTFSPLTDSVVVFDRRIQGQVQMLRVSGLLYNSNLVMYDEPQDPAARAAWTPSLWSQLGMRAIAGPAAAAEVQLEPLPGTNITSWKMWLAAHPETSIVLPDPGTKGRYKEFSYARYCLTPRVEFPVSGLVAETPEPMTAEAALAGVQAGAPRSRKTAVIQVRAGGARQTWSTAELVQLAGGKDGTIELSVGGVPLEVQVQHSPLAAMVRAKDGSPVVVVPQLWFAHEAHGW